MHRSEPRRRSRGFTLIEAVIVIAITGVLAATLSLFIVAPVQGYLATSARGALAAQGDGALRRIGRDLRSALPNSTRVTASGLALEFIPTTAGARYATDGTGRLDFTANDTSFDVLGPPLVLSANQQLVFYNLGPGVTGSDAYAPNATAAEQAASNRRASSNGAGAATTVGLASLAALPPAANAPPYRVQAVEPPVTYRCDIAAGTLRRYQGYGWQATQPDPPGGGTSAVLASGVSACRFSADATLVAARAALVTLTLTLTANGESVRLLHAVHVDNLP